MKFQDSSSNKFDFWVITFDDGTQVIVRKKDGVHKIFVMTGDDKDVRVYVDETRLVEPEIGVTPHHSPEWECKRHQLAFYDAEQYRKHCNESADHASWDGK